MAIEGKQCSRCKSVKPGECFYKDRGRIDGLARYCKSCRSVLGKRLRNSPGYKEKASSRRDRWISENRDRYRYTHARRAATIRGMEFPLSLVEYSLIVISGLCHYCGNPLPLNGGGLDRVDNSDGYIVGNLVPCCGDCNRMKGRFLSYGEMKSIWEGRVAEALLAA